MIGVSLESKLKSTQPHKDSTFPHLPRGGWGDCEMKGWRTRKGKGEGEADTAFFQGITYLRFPSLTWNVNRLFYCVESDPSHGNSTQAKAIFSNSFTFFFFIIATNWKTIHHINIIAIFQKKRKTKIKQHLYTFFATVLDNVDIYM